jgi:predicted DNA-binding protein YlxM (UPF0122 family)
MAKRTVLDKILEEADEAIQEQVEQLDAAIEKINERLAPYEKLNAKKEQFQRARNALLGGSRLTGGGTTRMSQEMVRDYLRENPGETIEEVAEGMNANRDAIRGHLYRGNNERFLTKDKHWWVRDPKNGINDVDDLPDPDDENEDEDD